jgi:hypothetical protein
VESEALSLPLLRPAAGAFNRETGNSALAVRGWWFDLAPKSEGIAPATEAISVSLGTREKNLDLSALVLQSEECVPVAIIVGVDDGFSGAHLVRPGGPRAFQSHTVQPVGDCHVGKDWPWVQS